jgi:hypothetical protein
VLLTTNYLLEEERRSAARRAAGETLTSIAQLFGVSHMTITRLEQEQLA